MKNILAIAVLIVIAANVNGQNDPYLKLWYNKPASPWEAALPLGNGKTGAMVFGGIAQEQLQLNEGYLWSGGPRDGNNPLAKEILPQVRQLLSSPNKGLYSEYKT